MNWKEFKDKLEELRVKDDDELWYVDVHFDFPIEVKKHVSLGWAIS